MHYTNIKTDEDVVEAIYGKCPSCIVEEWEENQDLALWINIVPKDDGEVNVEKVIDEAMSQYEDSLDLHYTQSLRIIETKIIKQAEHQGTVVIRYRIKDMY